MDQKTKKIIFSIISAATILLVFVLGFINPFKHGFYYEDYSSLIPEGGSALKTTGANGLELKFIPQKKLFRGFNLYLANPNEIGDGTLTVEIIDNSGRSVAKKQTDIAELKDKSQYKIVFNENFKSGQEYTAKFTTANADNAPLFFIAETDNLPPESVGNNIIISYGYSLPTFILAERIFIILIALGIWGLSYIWYKKQKKGSRLIKELSVLLILCPVMAWNYQYNTIDESNVRFYNFQADSQSLVESSVFGKMYYPDYTKEQLKGFGNSTKKPLLVPAAPDDTFINGYSANKAAVSIANNDAATKYAVPGGALEFKNNKRYEIQDVVENNGSLTIYLNAQHPLSEEANGKLSDATFIDTQNNRVMNFELSPAISQYGIQSKFWGLFTNILKFESIEQAVNVLTLICSLLTGFVLALISILLKYKYNALFAGCFFLTFWLSPWVVNFARNLYWMESLMFLPMAAGIVLAIKINSIKWRLFCYPFVFISILLKCLCGYEYISGILLMSVSFLLIDLFIALQKKDFKKAKLLLRVTLAAGFAALCGFAAAILLHASLRGEGNIIAGLSSIYQRDVLRRTIGADISNFTFGYWGSLSVYKAYTTFLTPVITGISNNLFPLMAMAPIGIFVFEYKKKNLDTLSLFGYIVFYVTSVSWFVLGKSHSEMHSHINYICWYFGFVQICLYAIINFIASGIWLKNKS